MSATEAEIAAIAKDLRMRPRARSLLAMSTTWATVSEMKPLATGSGCDVLYCMHLRQPLCERNWATWGGELGQRRSEGYEYRLTPLGLAVRAALTAQTKEQDNG